MDWITWTAAFVLVLLVGSGIVAFERFADRAEQRARWKRMAVQATTTRPRAPRG